jgi:outer membrane lipoprotein carrier protein
MKLYVIAAALSAAALAPLPAQPAQSVDATIDRAVAAYAKAKTARATFEQTITNPLTGTTVSAKGEYVQQKPGRLAVRFTEPSGDRIVSDGKVVWAYLPSANPGQVMKFPLTDDGLGSVDLTAQFLDDPKAKYTITDAGTATLSGRETHALALVPKAKMQFTKATVWVDTRDGTVRQFEVTDANGLTRLVRLTSLAVNVPVDAGAFQFTPPKGVKVIDQTAMMGQQ